MVERGIVRWQRIWAKEERVEAQEVENASAKIAYSSRLLECTGCGHSRETKSIQMRTMTGYRAIYCFGCKKQEVCTLNTCQCGIIWHLCGTHRTDPAVHRTNKALNMFSTEKAPRPKLDPRRKAPEILHEKPKKKAKARLQGSAATLKMLQGFINLMNRRYIDSRGSSKKEKLKA